MAEVNEQEVERILRAAPFIRDLGLQLESASPGECRTYLTLAERHLQQDGYVHAGVQATVADHTAGAAAASVAGAGQSVLTAEFKLNLLRSARGTVLRCVARVLKAGATLTVVESEVFCGTGDESRLVSKATVTLAIVTRREDTPA
ncbi:MAG: PaaI family thioesterase [Marinobacter sp.]|nr:PaaI family thioesterase [Marinobacter sp.]